MNPIALQLYTVRRAMAENPEAALRGVRAAGYSSVETAPLVPPLTAPLLSELLGRHGLQVVAAHSELPIEENRERILQEALELGATRIVWHGWPRGPAFDSLDGVRRLADCCNRAADAARKAGLEFGLHNHWWEFERLQGSYPYLLLHELLAPGVFLEIDVYWLRTAGLDPAQVISDLGPRVAMLHLKDGPAVHGQPMTALGEGTLDIAGIL
jgi:sugar phosphate isomerase/epimerase